MILKHINLPYIKIVCTSLRVRIMLSEMLMIGKSRERLFDIILASKDIMPNAVGVYQITANNRCRDRLVK